MHKNLARAFSRVLPEHQNRTYSPEMGTKVANAMENILVPFISKTYGKDVIGASIVVIQTLEDLLSNDVQLLKAGTLITPGHEMVLEIAKMQNTKVNLKSKADGLLYYEIIYNGPHLADVIRGVCYSFATERYENVTSEQDLYEVGKRMAKGKLPDRAVSDLVRILWSARNDPEQSREINKTMEEMCQSSYGKTQLEMRHKFITENARSCANCNKVGISFNKCSGCKAVYYCGVDCQKKHWPEHKKTCKK